MNNENKNDTRDTILKEDGDAILLEDGFDLSKEAPPILNNEEKS